MKMVGLKLVAFLGLCSANLMAFKASANTIVDAVDESAAYGEEGDEDSDSFALARVDTPSTIAETPPCPKPDNNVEVY